MFGSHPMSSPPALWSNGPTPGGMYEYPGRAVQPHDKDHINKHTTDPTTTGTSVIGLKFDGGVVLAADTLASYGRLARFKDCRRVMKVNDITVAAAGGDYADFQHIQSLIEEMVMEDVCVDDGSQLKPGSLYAWLTLLMYKRRSKFDPLWCTFVVGGLQQGKPFLGYVDKLGTAYEAPYIATGFGSYLAVPILSKAHEDNPAMSREQAEGLIRKCMQTLYYRDCQASAKFQIATVTAEGATLSEPETCDSNWTMAKLVGGIDGRPYGGGMAGQSFTTTQQEQAEVTQMV